MTLTRRGFLVVAGLTIAGIMTGGWMPKNAIPVKINKTWTPRPTGDGNAENITYDVSEDEVLDHWLTIVPEAGISQFSVGDHTAPGTGMIIHNVNGTGRLAFWNAGVEVERQGDLNGNWGYVDIGTYGLAIGEYAASKANMTYDPTNGLRLRIYDTDYITLSNAGVATIANTLAMGASGAITVDTDAVVIDTNGISLQSDSAYNAASSLKWFSGATETARLWGYKDAGINYVGLETLNVATNNSTINITSLSALNYLATIRLAAQSGSMGSALYLDLQYDENNTATSYMRLLKDETPFFTIMDTGDITTTGDITMAAGTDIIKGATTGYIYVPLATPLTSTSWDGDLYDTDNDEITVDTSTVFGVPAGVKALYVQFTGRCTTVDKSASVGPSAGNYSLVIRSQVTNVFINSYGIINCDANGDFYFATSAVHGAEFGVIISVWGYWI